MVRGIDYSVGLGGDGDEIAAIENVEREFGVTLDTSHANRWVTAGHIYAALCDALPPDAPVEERWDRFAAALAEETGADPRQLTVASRLIGPNVGAPWWIFPIIMFAVIGGAIIFG